MAVEKHVFLSVNHEVDCVVLFQECDQSRSLHEYDFKGPRAGVEGGRMNCTGANLVEKGSQVRILMNCTETKDAYIFSGAWENSVIYLKMLYVISYVPKMG